MTERAADRGAGTGRAPTPSHAAERAAAAGAAGGGAPDPVPQGGAVGSGSSGNGTGGGARGAPDRAPAQAYRLPDALRAELQRPFGPVLQAGQLPEALRGRQVVAVGDVVSLALKEAGIVPRAYVCDYQTQRGGASEMYRRELGSWGTRELKVRNPAGQVTREAWLAIREALHGQGPAPVRVLVEGEEDLLGIPCFLEAPAGWVVLYGMPGKGAVAVTVDEPLKERVAALLSGFGKARESRAKAPPADA